MRQIMLTLTLLAAVAAAGLWPDATVAQQVACNPAVQDCT
ncbi:hypothetical protein RGUI_2300 [Rhodovulum sp. P5]|nr:hypothetical protein RGUI_2300 [Rhodovulum sp. P5]